MSTRVSHWRTAAAGDKEWQYWETISDAIKYSIESNCDIQEYRPGFGWVDCKLIKQHVSDSINPPHYQAHPSGVDCIQVTEHMGFCLGNAIKYLWRCDMKGGTEDLEKAIWYIRREIERRNKEADKSQ